VRIVIGSDHAGVDYKRRIVEALESRGDQVVDVGTHSPDPVDYPDVAERVVKVLRDGECERGILICGSAVGVSIAANRFPGMRAAVCHDAYSARQAVEHDDANILCIGQRVIGEELAVDVVGRFLDAVFSDDERHVRRLEKIRRIERKVREDPGVE